MRVRPRCTRFWSPEFLSLLAHELRNPLAPIRHSSTFLRMVATDEKQGRALDIIDRQLAHLAHLIDDLVDGAQLERGLVTLRKQWVDIAGIARHALEAIQPRIDASTSWRCISRHACPPAMS
jgi:signal transduction histidine kinase